MPRTAWQWLLPKLSLPCLSAGVALSVIGAPPRSIRNSSVRPALALTIRCMSEKLSIVAAVDREHDVAGLEARRGGRAVGLHRVDPRGRGLLAVEREDRGKNHDRQNEIRDRAGGHDGRAAAHRLMKEALRGAPPGSCRRRRPDPARWRHFHRQKISHSRRAEWPRSSSGFHDGR